MEKSKANYKSQNNTKKWKTFQQVRAEQEVLIREIKIPFKQ